MDRSTSLLSSTTLAALLTTMTIGSVILAIPKIMVYFDASLISALWIVLSYLIALVSTLSFVGPITDRLGRKRTFMIGIAIFALASAVLGFSPSITFLIAMRVIQALGGAFIMTNSSALVTEEFSESGKLGYALSINQIAVSAGFAIGPIIGGVLAQFDWRLVFWFNAPIGIFVLFWANSSIKGVKESLNVKKFDIVGGAILTFLITMFALVLTVFPFYGFPSTSYYISGAAMLAALVILFLFEKRAEDPLFDPSLFSNPRFSVSMAVNALNGIATGSLTFILTLLYQGPFGMSPFIAAIYMVPFAVAWTAISPISGLLADKVNPAKVASVGLGLVAAGMLLISISTSHAQPLAISLYSALVGLGAGMFNSPNNKFIMSIPPPHKRGFVAGTMGLFRNLGSVLSFSILIPLILSYVSLQQLLQVFIIGGGAPSQIIGGFMLGLSKATELAFIIALVALPISFLRGVKGGIKGQEKVIQEACQSPSGSSQVSSHRS